MVDIVKKDTRSPKRIRRDNRVKALRQLDKDGMLSQPDVNDTKPTGRQKKVFTLMTDKLKTLEPKDAIKQSIKEVYGLQASQTAQDNIMQSKGLQQLAEQAEKLGLNHYKTALKLNQGIDDDNKSIAHRYLELWTRLRYPDAYRNNINIDNRTINMLDNYSDNELERYLQDKPIQE